MPPLNLPPDHEAKMRLGDILRAAGHATEDQLDGILAEQRMKGGRLGAMLVGRAALNAQNLARSLAAQYHLPFIDLIASPPDPALLKESDCEAYISLELLPWRMENGTIVIATTGINGDMLAWADDRFGRNYRIAITTLRDIRHVLQQHFAVALDLSSRETLHNASPSRSAKILFSRHERRTLIVTALLLAAAAAVFTQPVLVGLLCIMNLFYCFTITLKGLLLYQGLLRKPASPPAIADAELPVYTVLVPLYHETESLPHLLSALHAIDYPHDRLDIKLIIEEEDEATLAAAKALRPADIFEIIRVPYSLPRTKPKACNYALHFARGAFVTIYDAEDVPDPKQLRAAVARFRTLPPEVVCLQARLNYYNAPRSLLTRLFAIEYSTWFDFMLPGLERLRIPIPLGGTSNHMPLSILREIGGWDPYNVAEDADLGVRLAVSGYKTAMLDSITMEEAPAEFWAWVRQRSRWIKGYMQTWIVHMRDPVALMQTIGGPGFLGFQFFVAGPCLVFLTAPFLWAVWLGWATGWLSLPAALFPWWMGPLAGFNLMLGVAVHAAMALMALGKWRWGGMGSALILYPFYWLLHSIAAYRALWQLITCPHYWEKTTHSAAGRGEILRKTAAE